ncbi:hypothetical protein LSCM1_07596 [Leishmania martiniquensis]|uniref:E3 ubiquitin-protein ligase n=1 Tax=Leishmania martiniquensis TaxID=1580590 RepID=A0A836KWK6_9TRYP|nr:hypothetical protein LSCM1_07596 [Leishmania martiniquensis]
MGYDPDIPSTWSIKQLLEYARQRGIEVPSGCEKSELVTIVHEYFADELITRSIRTENTLDTDVIADILNANTESILRHVAHPSYISVLRRHPAKLEAIIAAGIDQLQSLSFVARLCSARMRSPVEAWLCAFASDCGDGKSLLTALASPNSDVAVSPVCGRFCGEQEMVVRCLDCGADSTCVMCMDCFRHSPCVNHRYRITQSSGGGMCDCGDPTAWKPESFCSRHRAAAAAVAATAGDWSSASSPLNFMAEEDRVWVVPALRGMIQFIAVTLLQHTRLHVMRKRALSQGGKRRMAVKSTESSATTDKRTGAAGSASTTSVSGAEAALLSDAARISDKFDWLEEWMTEVTRQLWELMQASDVAKQLVAQLWAEPVRMAASGSLSAAPTHTAMRDNEEEVTKDTGTETSMADPVLDALPPNFTCVHMAFLHEASRPVTAHERPLKAAGRSAPWLNNLLRCVGHCLSDSKFRFPIGGLMAAYAEFINAQERTDDKIECLSQYQVQVLTNPDVIRHLMTPAHLPYKAATNTLLHRELSSLFYALWLARDDISDASSNPVTRTAALSRDGLLFVAHQATPVSLASVTALQSCLSGSPAACYTLVLNRLAWRAFAQLAGSLAISGYIRKDPDAPTDSQHYPTPDFIARCISRHMWLWVHAMRVVISCLLRLPETVARDPSAAMSPISPDTITKALGVTMELWETWRGATAFDTPPDRLRQSAGLMMMLSACRVANGAEEALLLLERGPLAAVQSRALQLQPVGEEGGAAAKAKASVMASPSLATAMGYVTQALYEVSRTLDVVFEKQRDGFCRRCRSVVLQRQTSVGSLDSPPASSGDGASRSEEARDTETHANYLAPSTCLMDIAEYTLLEPHAHAATFSNHLPRVFGAVLSAWVIEHQRTVSRRQSAASPSSATPAEVLATTRISGLPSASISNTIPAEEISGAQNTATHASRPLRFLLNAFFQVRAEVTGNAQDRLTFSQQLLDALVMPHVLAGQVFDGLWRRGDYDVPSAVAMYLTFSRGVSAELDILMMQVLTMELAPADMALQVLQRFSYTKRSLSDAEAKSAQQARGSHASAPHRPHPVEKLTGEPSGALPTALTARRSPFRRYLNGYKHFLRLTLTIVTDVSKAAFQPPMSSAVIERIVGGLLAHGKASHSSIVVNVNGTARGGDYGDADEDEKDSSGNVIKFSRLVDAAIRKVAVAEDSTHGKQFRLKDVDVWRSHVDLYRVGVIDSHLEGFHRTYRSLVSAANAAKQKAAEPCALADGAKAGDPTGGGGLQQQRISLPPTQLSDTSMYAELVPTTRALLHTDAVLLPALYILHEYANCHVPLAVAATSDAQAASAQGESMSTEASAEALLRSQYCNARHEGVDVESHDTESESEDNRDGNDAEAANLITREALLHATTTLFLCVQDCVSITRAMQAIEGDSSDTPSADRKGLIAWDLVELCLRRSGVSATSFTHASCAQWLPLPELVACETLRQKLQAPVRLRTAPSNTAPAFVTTSSSVDMLHRLRGYLLSNGDADPYGCLEMVEAVLVQTGLATFDTGALLAEQRAKDEAAQSRKKVIQERQAMLMQRMRSRALKSSGKAKTASAACSLAPPSAAAAPPQQDGPCGGTSGPTAAPLEKPLMGGAIGSLLAKLLLELTTVDCCVCRSATEESLFLLCHTGTSGVLPQLGVLSLPDRRPVHSHLSVCGHAAHKSCVEKVFVRLSLLWQRWNFRSQFYLGPTEFNCPVCTTIITALCPMPVLPSSSSGGGGACDSTTSTSLAARVLSSAATPIASLFEELQNGTVSANNPRAVGVATELHTTLANAAVGFSPSEDVPAIVAAEDELQRTNEAAWQLSEAIRAFCYACHLQLEAVKAGQDLSHRDLIGLLSVLVSIMPAGLQRHQAELHTNYARNVQDKESLLVMDALLRPRDASRLISAHVMTQVLPSLPANFVSRLVAVVCNGNRDGDGEGTCAVAAASLEAEFEDMTTALWRTVGVLTLLKALVVEDAHHDIVLSSSTFTVAGAVGFATLSVAGVRTPVARCTSVVRMLQYLLPVPHKGIEVELHVVAQDVSCMQAATEATLSCSGRGMEVLKAAVPYTTPEEWVARLSEEVLHLPSVYTTVLTRFAAHKLCTVCHQEPTKPVVCCRCGKLMCMQPPNSPPELYTHTRTCAGAVGIFLVVRTASFYVLELTSGRVYQYSSNYTDEYGEHDRNLRRGVPLFRNTEETHKLVLTWMLNKWGALSAIFGTSNRMDLATL